jgi:hypothetical protein
MSYSEIYVKLKKLVSKTYAIFNKPAFYPGYVFLFFVCYFIVTYMTLDKVFAQDDLFFHIRFAELFREKGFAAFTDFQSIYFSRMGIVKDYRSGSIYVHFAASYWYEIVWRDIAVNFIFGRVSLFKESRCQIPIYMDTIIPIGHAAIRLAISFYGD